MMSQFEVRSTSRWSPELKKIMDDYPELSKYNIEFKKQNKYNWHGEQYIIEKAFVKFESINDLLEFVKDCGDRVVIQPNHEGTMYEIEIYDDWRE